MGIYRRGKVWWYKFTWNGEVVRESTKQANKRIAGQLEAARKTQFAKGEVGIKDRKAPTLDRFMCDSFVPFLEATKSGEPNTITFYKKCIRNLLAWRKLADSRLSEIDPAMLAAFIAQRRESAMSTATINRELATLRRPLRLAHEWVI